jgi:hypothetical protein
MSHKNEDGSGPRPLRDKRGLVNRVRRLRGQVDAIERALAGEASCSDPPRHQLGADPFRCRQAIDAIPSSPVRSSSAQSAMPSAAFTGIVRPEEFRIVTRAHAIASRRGACRKSETLSLQRSSRRSAW